jgi:hypothetical protein
MSDINKLGLNEQLRRGTTVRKIVMTSELDLSEQLQSRSTRRTVVTTGAKLAYAAPLVAATVALTAGGALAACGGATPIAFTGAGGDLLCCGCCSQAGLSASEQRAQRRVTAQQTSGDFTTCQTLLANQGTTCSRTGNPRVCIAENDNPIISPVR